VKRPKDSVTCPWISGDSEENDVERFFDSGLHPKKFRANVPRMPSTEPLRDAYHDLESALDAAALEFAASGLTVTREQLGSVRLVAQAWNSEDEFRYDFRDDAATPFGALHFVPGRVPLTVELQSEGSETFDSTQPWANFDTLSKLLILEGCEAAAGSCG
jgi:hypothetical protein